MQRDDWTPAVLATALISLLTAALVWVFFPAGFGDEEPGATRPRRRPPDEVVVWTGEIQPGLKGVLGPIWGDPGPDLEHDRELNEELGLEELAAGADAGAAPRWYRLLLFNLGAAEQVLPLTDGALTIAAPDGGPSAPMGSLSRWLREGVAEAPPGLAFTLQSHGALNERLQLPPGTSAHLVLPFAGPVDLEDAEAVRTAEGRQLTRRPMERLRYRRLLEGADEEALRDL